jgi:hypothetical protein
MLTHHHDLSRRDLISLLFCMCGATFSTFKVISDYATWQVVNPIGNKGQLGHILVDFFGGISIFNELIKERGQESLRALLEILYLRLYATEK